MHHHAGLYTDYYELTMSQGYFLSDRMNERACFDYFFRSNPYQGGFLVFAGLEDFLEVLENFSYSPEDLEYLESTGLRKEFIRYMKDFRFTGTIYSMREGEIAFPTEPLIRVEGNLIETQLIETLLLSFMNFESLIATKAFRVKLVTGKRPFAEFGLRRAQGIGGIQASRAAIIGGATSTSNVYAGQRYNVPVSGTQAHSWIQSFDDELTAFRKYAEFNPDQTILLVDTYNTLQSGVPNAIIVAKELEEKGHRMLGVRLDSGDLAYLSKKARKMLDDAGLNYIKIVASNQLNEHLVNSLNEQQAPIDSFGIGTEMITGKPDAALDGVYKLAACNGQPRIKISENIEKITLPGTKELYRYYDEEGMFYRDGIQLKGESENTSGILYHPSQPLKKTTVKGLKKESLLEKVFENGKMLIPSRSPIEIHSFLEHRASLLSDEVKRFVNPHLYKVGISEGLQTLRDNMLHGIQDKKTHL
ncbi:MAG: nicotinate phosphoribosyltransferase [Bacteroidota bacterium]|nr:nicotinate phosphoribosyltransferase [Bacteroidota bacterium]